MKKVRVMDPWTAGEKIIDFLAKKVRSSKALLEFRKRLLEKNAEKTRFTVEKLPMERFSEAISLVSLWDARIEELKHTPALTDEDKEKLDRAGGILEGIRMYYIDIRQERVKRNNLKAKCRPSPK
jgi:hypothetical protein